jgi:general stress protein YciG
MAEKNNRGKSERGFASMDKELQREIASKGGRAAHAQGVAHEFNSEEAREAGRKGGERSRGRRSEQGNPGRVEQGNPESGR